ncbi:MAG: amino acid ABC transporter periplasmic protein [Candidatus Magnetoglobus multicellularis str. Araruama]|uniref:Amino acid ABC transporter periplasmic protein n=1 Tax=Candidatus Magnetoglobus multicellularis str. Araruama TaxID=890399 RepID=A0A1V1NZP6_9BACT|nr:MAG: amino acid ABC transporter periplasmic protein [Candidatus Magnetoglobus multicellularis str. Araruama]
MNRYRIGVTRGYAYTKEFWEAGESGMLKLAVVAHDVQNIRKLLAGRIDIFPLEYAVFLSLITKQFDPDVAQKIGFHPKSLVEESTCLLFPKIREDSEKLMNIFNQGLNKLKQDGTYEKLTDNLLKGYYELKQSELAD